MSTATSEERFEINFFLDEEWTGDTENALMQKVHEIISAIRPMGVSLCFHLELQVTDSRNAVFLINKKLRNEVEVNQYKLSSREIEVLELIMLGLTNNEIAERLFISYETVKSHRKNIMMKTGAKNTASLIHHYHQTFFDKETR